MVRNRAKSSRPLPRADAVVVKFTDVVQPVAADPIMQEIPEEEQQQVYRQAQELIGSSFEVGVACTAMLWARRFYTAALERLVASVNAAAVRHPDLVASHLSRSMANQAKTPFTRQELLETSPKMLEWLGENIRQDQEVEESRRRELLKTHHVERRSQPVKVCATAWAPAGQLARMATLTLTGDASDVATELEQAYATAQGTQHVLRLTAEKVALPAMRGRQKTLQWPVNKWQGRGASELTFTRAMTPAIDRMDQLVVDLLIIDDLRLLVGDSLAGVAGSDVRNAAKKLRHVQRWAEQVGCAVLCGMPLYGQEATEWPLTDSFIWGDLLTTPVYWCSSTTTH